MSDSLQAHQYGLAAKVKGSIITGVRIMVADLAALLNSLIHLFIGADLVEVLSVRCN